MQIRRLIAVTAAALACVAPAASARPIDLAPQTSPPRVETNYATMAAHRDTVSSQQLQQAASTTPKPIVDDTGAGSDFPAVALVAGLALFSLLAAQLIGKSVVRHRRRTRVA